MGERRIRVADASRGADLGPAGRRVGAHATSVAARREAIGDQDDVSPTTPSASRPPWPAVLAPACWFHGLITQMAKG
jgi:hypothetical protein